MANDINNLKIDLVADIAGSSIESAEVRAIAKSLAKICKLNLPIFIPSEINKSMSSEDITFMMKHHKGQSSPDIVIFGAPPPTWEPHPTAYNIGIVTWPTSKLPSLDMIVTPNVPPERNNWAKQIAKMDEIWVFNSTCEVAVKDSGYKKPITRMAIPIDTEFWKPDTEPLEKGILGVTYDSQGNKIDISQKFVIGMIADWEQKNDLDAFITCSLMGIPPSNGVVVLKTHDHSGAQQVVNVCRQIKNRLVIKQLPQLVVIDEDMNDEELRGLIASFDVYLSSSRAESINLPLMWAMSMKKPVIAGGHSGHQDYMTDKNAVPIPVNLEIVRTDMKSPWFQCDQIWAKINEVNACQAIQSFHAKLLQSEGNKLVVDGARDTIVNNYSLEIAEKKFKHALRRAIKNAKRIDLGTRGKPADTKVDSQAEIPSIP